MIIPIYKGDDRDPEGLSIEPGVTQLVSGKAGIQTQAVCALVLLLSPGDSHIIQSKNKVYKVLYNLALSQHASY